MATTRLQDRLTRWEVLNANLKQHLENMPQLKDKQAEFEALIARDVALAAQYSQLIGSARSIVTDRQALAKRGNQLRNIFVAELLHAFGPESKQLQEFGVRPRIRRKKAAAPGTLPEAKGAASPAAGVATTDPAA